MPETGSIPDPRTEALRREMQFDKTTIQLILEAVDAADRTAHVRRVTEDYLRCRGCERYYDANGVACYRDGTGDDEWRCEDAADELADNLELARAEERQRLADAILSDHWQTTEMWGGVRRLACGRCRHGDGVRFLWPCPTRRAITGEAEPEPNSALLSADSPVGGVS